MYILNDIRLHQVQMYSDDLTDSGAIVNGEAAKSLLRPSHFQLPIAVTAKQYLLWLIRSGTALLVLDGQPAMYVSAGQWVLLEPNCHYVIQDAYTQADGTHDGMCDLRLSRNYTYGHKREVNGEPLSWLEIAFDYMYEIELPDQPTLEPSAERGQEKQQEQPFRQAQSCALSSVTDESMSEMMDFSDPDAQLQTTSSIHLQPTAVTERGQRRFVCASAPFACIGLLPQRYGDELWRLAGKLWVAISPCTAQTGANRGNLADVLFQQIMHELVCMVPESASALPAVADNYMERTIAYMELHYAQPITRNELAHIAGLSPWYYSTLFQQHYRVSPMTYLNELRLRRAKEQLVIGKRSVRDIAERCGFRDESYFRRRFKAAAGITPLRFAGQSRERIADMSYAYVPHLLALQIVPCAAMINEERDIHRRPYHRSIAVPLPRQRHMTDALWQQNVTLLASAAPSVIVCDDAKERMPYRQQLEQIAPVCTYRGNSWIGAVS
ncbi:AraC family transcriptional regulator [Paenibacillus campi]|uniref:helix-turn-helix transcriptional regulator n=1 Tax=Paenibacillus campi TaxID=3106031 RepID=UPI002AFE4CAB|nr:AraC family transcriptional regulator [Paenibacillus sp. SGZ-1009]